MARCLEIDETKRISVNELANTPFFRKLLNNQLTIPLPNHQILNGSSNEARGYVIEGGKVLQHSDHATVRRKVSADIPFVNLPPSPHVIKLNQASYDKTITGITPMQSLNKPFLQLPKEETRDRRAVSSSKPTYLIEPVK